MKDHHNVSNSFDQRTRKYRHPYQARQNTRKHAMELHNHTNRADYADYAGFSQTICFGANRADYADRADYTGFSQTTCFGAWSANRADYAGFSQTKNDHSKE